MDRGGEMYQTGKVHLTAVTHRHSLCYEYGEVACFVLNVYMR